MQDSGTRKINIRWEVSPFLQKAVSELNQILTTTLSKEENIKLILEEMRRLEDDAAHRIDYIRSLVESI